MTQGNLFSEPDLIPQGAPKVHQSGAVLRDRGINQAIQHANSETEGWSEKAMRAIIRYVDIVHYGFRAEEFREWAEGTDGGLESPPHARAYGGIMIRAAKIGLIKRIGFSNTTNPKSHCTPASLWEVK